MNYLLDTHTFLFSAFSHQKLSKKAEKIITDTENDIYVSTITFWEISLKYSLGKLDIKDIQPEQLLAVANKMGFILLELSPKEAASFYKLPKSAHKDPFDRMLIWQAIQQEMVLISKDAGFKDYLEYGLQLVW